MRQPGFRRRILIEPGQGAVSAELEDDWHHMRVTLHHADGLVFDVSSQMERWPWTTCRGATDQLSTTFAGLPLANFVKRGERATNCTHLHDLALFAAAHAGEEHAVAYDVSVSDPLGGNQQAVLVRDGETALSWQLRDRRFVAPPEIAGRTVAELGDWIAGLDRRGQEAARILRWAIILTLGRAMNIPAGVSARAFAGASCYTFRPAMAEQATRVPDSHVDFSESGAVPLRERAEAFSPSIDAGRC